MRATLARTMNCSCRHSTCRICVAGAGDGAGDGAEAAVRCVHDGSLFVRPISVNKSIGLGSSILKRKVLWYYTTCVTVVETEATSFYLWMYVGISFRHALFCTDYIST